MSSSIENRRDRRSRTTRRALILAAGLGRRLWPETKDRPKCLVDLAGKPILLRLLEGLLEVGVDEWVFVTGYRENMIRDAIQRWKLPSHSVQWVRNGEYDCTNTLYSVGLAEEMVKDRDFLLLNADLWVRSSELKKLVAGSPRHAMLVDQDVQLDEEAMKVCLDDTGRIRAISKQLSIPASAGESIGAYSFDRESGARFLKRINKQALNGGRNSYYEAALDEL